MAVPHNFVSDLRTLCGDHEPTGSKSEKYLTTCLIQAMFLQICPPWCTWAVSTASMQDRSLCIAALGLQLLMGVSVEVECLTFAQSRRATFLTDMTFCKQAGFVFRSLVSLPQENQQLHITRPQKWLLPLLWKFNIFRLQKASVLLKSISLLFFSFLLLCCSLSCIRGNSSNSWLCWSLGWLTS